MDDKASVAATIAELLSLAQIDVEPLTSGQALHFDVDGVAIAASLSGRYTKLSGTIGKWRDLSEAEIRSLMSQYLLQIRHGGGLLSADEGRIELSIVIEDGDDARQFVADFFDAAVHWHGVVQSFGKGRSEAAGRYLTPEHRSQ